MKNLHLPAIERGQVLPLETFKQRMGLTTAAWRHFSRAAGDRSIDVSKKIGNRQFVITDRVFEFIERT